MPRGLLGVVVALVVLGAPGTALAIGTTYSFDSDAQGWLANQTGGSADGTPATWVSDFPSPGGHLQITDADSQTVPFGALLTTPLGFGGDYSSAYGGTLSVDLETNTAWADGRLPSITIGSTAPTAVTCAFPAAAVPPNTGFHTLTATLSEGLNPSCTWQDNGSPVTHDAFVAILAHLDGILVSADVNNPAGETVGLDNVVLIGPPDTTITSTTPALITSSSTAIAFASATGTAFQCSLDGGAFAPCASPDTLTGLSDGAHTFAVRALIGTVADLTPATVSFAVDAHPVVVPPPAPPPLAAPKLQNVSLSGGTILFTSTRAGTVSLTVVRRTTGHKRAGHRCSSKLRHGPHCTISTTVFHTSHAAKVGAGRFTFGRSALRRGSYRATITLTVAGAKPVSVVRTFSVR